MFVTSKLNTRYFQTFQVFNIMKEKYSRLSKIELLEDQKNSSSFREMGLKQ